MDERNGVTEMGRELWKKATHIDREIERERFAERKSIHNPNQIKHVYNEQAKLSHKYFNLKLT